MSVHDGRPHWVYEMWAGDRCLYVGMTSAVKRRIGDHRRTKSWWSQVTEVRTTACANWAEANYLESHTIFKLRPAHNLRWNPDYDKTLLDRPGFQPAA